MLWIAISDNSIIYGYCEKKSKSGTISRIFKKNLKKSVDSVFYRKEVVKNIHDILTTLRNDNVTDKRVALSIPVTKTRIFINKVDNDLNNSEKEDMLNWKVQSRLPESDSLFFQHYPINPDDINDPQFFSLIVKQELRDDILSAIINLGFQPKLFNVGIFSAYQLLKKSFPLQAYNRWIIWEVGKKNHSQNYLIIDNGVLAIISVIFQENGDFVIQQNTDPEKFNEDFIENLIYKNFDALNIDKVFAYSMTPTDAFVQEKIKEGNQVILNPVPVLSNKKAQIEKKYLLNKFVISQFSEIAGLIVAVE